jgi:hypothetical protein
MTESLDVLEEMMKKYPKTIIRFYPGMKIFYSPTKKFFMIYEFDTAIGDREDLLSSINLVNARLPKLIPPLEG